MTNDKEFILLLNDLAQDFHKHGEDNLPPTIDNLGRPDIKELYEEIYRSFKSGNQILALAGERILLEHFINMVWVSSKFRQEQLKGSFINWEKSMEYKKALMAKVENLGYEAKKKDINNIFENNDFKNLELIYNFSGNSAIHSKFLYFIKLFQKHNLLSYEMPVGRGKIVNGKVHPETTMMDLAHPLFLFIGFKRVAEQAVGPILLFIHGIVVKYSEILGPLPDKQLGFN